MVFSIEKLVNDVNEFVELKKDYENKMTPSLFKKNSPENIEISKQKYFNKIRYLEINYNPTYFNQMRKIVFHNKISPEAYPILSP